MGCLTGGQSPQNGTRFLDVFEMYVKDERDRLIVDGWEKLMRDADPTIIWNPASLELVCKAAIECMAPFSDERLSTKELLDKLRDAILSNTNASIQHPEADSATYCDICNDYRTDIKCSEGHALCSACIVDKLGDDSGHQLVCLIKECSSQPFQDDDLYGRIPVETYKRYVEKQAERKIWEKCFLRFESQFAGVQSQLSGLKFDVHGIKENVHKVAEGVGDVKMGVNESNAQLQKQQRLL